MSKKEQTISKGFWIKLGLVPFVMFAFAFALVPLYDTFCDITGLNGRNSNKAYEETDLSSIDKSRTVSIDFLAATSSGFPVTFYPTVKKMDVIPGKMYTINYIAENRSDKVIIGQAIPSVAPGIASQHFKKLKCFCFSNQTFEPKVPKEMPVMFFVDSALDKEIVNITLSYNFFKVKDASPTPVAGL